MKEKYPFAVELSLPPPRVHDSSEAEIFDFNQQYTLIQTPQLHLITTDKQGCYIWQREQCVLDLFLKVSHCVHHNSLNAMI